MNPNFDLTRANLNSSFSNFPHIDSPYTDSSIVLPWGFPSLKLDINTHPKSGIEYQNPNPLGTLFSTYPTYLCPIKLNSDSKSRV